MLIKRNISVLLIVIILGIIAYQHKYVFSLINLSCDIITGGKVGTSGSNKDIGNNHISRTQLRVATFNICSGYNLFGKPMDLSGRSRDYLIEGGFDIVGLQEVRQNSPAYGTTKDQITTLAQDTFPFKRFYNSTTVEDTADYGLGLLSKYEAVRHNQYTLPNHEASEPRILTQSEVFIRGKRIFVFVTHLEWNYDSYRQKQMSFIRDKLDSLKGQSFIVFGDWNVKSNSEYNIFSDYKIVNGYNNVWYSTYNKTADGLRTLDNIILSNDFKINKIDMIYTEDSDHSALYVDLEF
ncbi:endonuclease/exonuclease/phosphatase family protein [Clostridium polynesiense]|uniref:endonuclease/exonuclease/phosphatase family protein n=1 Tax=Clostridium polynesiense TaxID=1325933 RepID=UPI00058C3F07|nr:endonuclease/exonuclease/phosphatase family protein [Clostridium polynesiense]